MSFSEVGIMMHQEPSRRADEERELGMGHVNNRLSFIAPSFPPAATILPLAAEPELEQRNFLNEIATVFASFESACRSGDIHTVHALVSQQSRSRAFLHHGLILSLESGHVEIARYLLSTGAPITPNTPAHILSAPPDCQIDLFELLAQSGWGPNFPGDYGTLLLPKVVTHLPVLCWFLAHGANPNLGAHHDSDIAGPPHPQSCAALEAAAARGSVDAVRLLLNAGASIHYGTPLHFAAGACSPGIMPRSVITKEFDASRIPIMELLVERGADVNQMGQSRVVVHHPIMYAVMAGAVGRVRWLLEHGADPEARGAWGSAAEYVEMVGSEEMKQVLRHSAHERSGANGGGFGNLAIRFKAQ
ncbi:hypothetical protein N7466_010916 [Penicillium verhagenii]|uniref:uncharacterized protein n=1 Tax=Penicillium verhagenii TaxID=1562060 RepID=UPI0025454F26|nr:uncharacterized protein N7466_010916 [Penicillium verhagenii]KAJ5917362.1 hypothetical protein N7466_010916 [Penicillium verhagenii]